MTNGKLADELLDVAIFDTLREAQVLVERWRNHYTGEACGLSGSGRTAHLDIAPPAGPTSSRRKEPWSSGRLTMNDAVRPVGGEKRAVRAR